MGIIEPIIFILIGGVSGIFSGALGIGGGLIVVPALTIYYGAIGSSGDIYLMASSTSLVVMIFTTLSGAVSHLKYKTIDFKLVRYLLIGTVTGSVLGRCLLLYLSHTGRNFSSITFLAIVTFIAFRLCKSIFYSDLNPKNSLEHNQLLYAVFFISVLGAWHGIGVGSLLVPWLLYRMVDQKNATAISTVCNFILSITATIIIFTYSNHLGPNSIFDVISLKAVATIGLASFITSPIGVILTRKIQPRIFKLVMLCFILSLALQQIVMIF